MKITLIFYVLNIVLSFIARNIFIKILGADVTGLNSLFTSLIGFLNVAELGVGAAVGYSLYEPLSKRNYKKINDIMILFRHYYKNIAKIVLVLGIILSIFLPFLIKGQVNIKLAYLYYFLYLINCAFSYLFTYKQTLIIADQKQYKIASHLNLTKIIKVIIQCLILYIIPSFFAWLIIEVIFNLLGMILANKRIDLEYGNNITYSNEKTLKLIKLENFEIGKNIRNVFFHKIGGFVIFQTDAIVISLFSTLKETAIYANYMMIINSLTGLLSNAIGSIMPSIGNLIAEETKEKSYKIFRKLFLFDHLIAIFISIVTYKIINQFIIFWVGKEYLFNKYIVLTLIINLYIQISRGTVDRFKDGFGIYWDIYAPVIESIINIIFSVGLAYKIGIIGVFIGTIISNIIIVEIWKPYILFKEGFNQNIIKFITQSLNIYIRNIIIILASHFLYNKIYKYIDLGNIFINIILDAILISVICIVVIMVVYSSVKEFKDILNTILRQLLLRIKNR